MNKFPAEKGRFKFLLNKIFISASNHRIFLKLFLFQHILAQSSYIVFTE